MPIPMPAALTGEQRAMVVQALRRLGQRDLQRAFMASLGEVLKERAFVGDGELWRFLRDLSRQVITRDR